MSIGLTQTKNELRRQQLLLVDDETFCLLLCCPTTKNGLLEMGQAQWPDDHWSMITAFCIFFFRKVTGSLVTSLNPQSSFQRPVEFDLATFQLKCTPQSNELLFTRFFWNLFFLSTHLSTLPIWSNICWTYSLIFLKWYNFEMK